LKTRCWKLIDFGICSQATSMRDHTTSLARGTASYRAPEVLSEDATYTNKVDIWSLGCILHELLTGKKAFHSDWNVREYAYSDTLLDIPVPVPQPLQMHISDNIHELLSTKPRRRPRARSMSMIYDTCCRHYHQLYTQAFEDAQSFISYGEWREIAELYPNEENFEIQITETITPSGDGACAVNLWKEMTLKSANPDKYFARLHSACQKYANVSAEINIWKTLIVKHEQIADLWNYFEAACGKLEEAELVADAWFELANKLPHIPEPLCRLAEWYSRNGDIDRELEVWEDLVYKFPTSERVVHGLAVAVGWKLGNDNLIERLNNLAHSFPTSEPLLAHLADASVRVGDTKWESQIWKELLLKHGYSIALCSYLKAVCERVQDADLAIAIWRDLVLCYPDQLELWDCLNTACKRGGTEKEIATWREISLNLPDWRNVYYRLAEAYENVDEIGYQNEIWQKFHQHFGLDLWEEGDWDTSALAGMWLDDTEQTDMNLD
jgi:tetratricopeptide (TPR) repeat protein